MYRIKYRKAGQWFFRSVLLKGHQYNDRFDKLMGVLPDGSMHEIPEWSKMEIKLGQDFLEFMRKAQNDHAADSQAADHK